MTRTSLLALAFVLVFGGTIPVSLAQSDPAKAQDQKQESKKEEPKQDPKVTAYEAAIKDLKRIDGPIPIYLRKKDVLVEISEDQIGRILLCQATLASGISSLPFQAGDPVGDSQVEAYRIDKNDEQIWLVRPNLKFRWQKDDPLAIASERSLPEAILAGYRIEQTEPVKKLYLVNMTGFFNGDVNQLNEMVNAGAGGQYMLDRDKSGVDSVKGFPKNTVVRMKLHYWSPRGAQVNPLLELLGLVSPSQLEDSRSVPLKVTYSLSLRQDTDYVPRLSDPRVGYFTEDFYSLQRFLNDDRTQRFIARWNLVKEDPQAAVSEPVKPIEWTLDPSIPKEYRSVVKEGILRWNRAFEAAGFKDAIRVNDVPENDPDYDHADGRYNLVRWTMSPSASYAVANIRTDPFTGEILNAAVTIDANLVYYIVQEHQKISTPAATTSARTASVFLRDPKRTMPVDTYLWDYEREVLRRSAEQVAGKHGWNRSKCEMGEGLADQAAFAYTAALATGGMRVSKEEYVKKFVANIVSHEVGHCLGLRHNFVASTFLSTNQLANDAYTAQHGTTGSTMDYNPVNVQAVLRGYGNFYTPTLGPYDLWAIQYGYMPFGAKDPLDEKSRLAKIASRSGEPGLAFMTDESADDWDPYVVRFDNAKDPIAYSSKQMEATRRALSYALTNLPRPGESYAKRTEVLLRAISGLFKEGRLATRFVGGVTASRTFKGDAGERATLQPVDAVSQRQALRLIVRNCLAPGAIEIPQSAMLNLSQDLNQESAAGWNAPMREFISIQQQMLYAMMMSADTTDRIAENSFKLGPKSDSYTLSEHFSAVLNAVFYEVGKGTDISPLRRDLQRFAVAGLITQAGAGQGQLNTDTRLLASDSLKRLSARYGSQLQSAKKLDAMTRLYLKDTKELMDRFLARQIATPR